MKALTNLAMGVVASAAIAISVPSAQAQVAVDSLGLTGGWALSFDGFNFLAPTFTTGPSVMQIDEIILSLGFASSGQDEFNLDLYAFDGTSPVGPVLASSGLSISGVDALAFQDFSFNKAALGTVGSYDLMANTAYALVLSTDIGSISLEDNDMPPNAYVFGEGFTTAGNGYYISSDSGSNWSPLDWTPIIQMSVSSPASPAAVPGPLSVLGAAAAFGYSRKLRKRIKASKVPVASAIG